MRALHLAVVAALLALPFAARAQNDGAVGGKVGPNLEAAPAQPGSTSGSPYGTRPTAGYAGTVAPGQVVPQNVPVQQGYGGFGHAFVNGHQVLVDPNTNRILRVFN
jgi:hypothetical protein